MSGRRPFILFDLGGILIGNVGFDRLARLLQGEGQVEVVGFPRARQLEA